MIDDLRRQLESAARDYARAADRLEAATGDQFNSARRECRLAEQDVLACALNLGRAPRLNAP